MEGGGQTAMAGATGNGSGKPLTCPTCGDQFTRLHILQMHRRIHVGQRAATEMSFTRSAALGSFQMCNYGERFSFCDVCGKGFTVAALLARHQAAHTGEEPRSCGRCGQTFALAANYRSHRRLHCRARTADEDQLEMQRRRHALRFSFVCRLCGQGYSRSHYLDRHARMHGLEPPPAAGATPSSTPSSSTPSSSSSSFICHICGDSFARWCSLQEHRCPQPEPVVRAAAEEEEEEEQGVQEPARGPDK